MQGSSRIYSGVGVVAGLVSRSRLDEDTFPSRAAVQYRNGHKECMKSWLRTRMQAADVEAFCSRRVGKDVLFFGHFLR